MLLCHGPENLGGMHPSLTMTLLAPCFKDPVVTLGPPDNPGHSPHLRVLSIFTPAGALASHEVPVPAAGRTGINLGASIVATQAYMWGSQDGLMFSSRMHCQPVFQWPNHFVFPQESEPPPALGMVRLSHLGPGSGLVGAAYCGFTLRFSEACSSPSIIVTKHTSSMQSPRATPLMAKSSALCGIAIFTPTVHSAVLHHQLPCKMW